MQEFANYAVFIRRYIASSHIDLCTSICKNMPLLLYQSNVSS